MRVCYSQRSYFNDVSSKYSCALEISSFLSVLVFGFFFLILESENNLDILLIS